MYIIKKLNDYSIKIGSTYLSAGEKRGIHVRPQDSMCAADLFH